MELLSCKERHFQLWLVDFHVQKVSSSLSKWFLHTLDNQMVSNSVFKVTRIIYIVRYAATQTLIWGILLTSF